MSDAEGRIVVVRHADTEWSAARRHTGRTDIPLSRAGEAAAIAARPKLADVDPALVLASPLHRAWLTAELLGLQPERDDDLLEWDYGSYEGRTTAEIRETLGDPGWDVWDTTSGLGETVDAVGERTARVLARCAPVVAAGGTAVLVAHAHVLRILTAVHLGLPAERGRSFALGPAGVGVLAHEREMPVIAGWNL